MEIIRLGGGITKIEITKQELCDCGTSFDRLSLCDSVSRPLIKRALSAAYGSSAQLRRVFVEAYPTPEGGALLFAALLSEEKRDTAVELSIADIKTAAKIASLLPQKDSELREKDDSLVMLIYASEPREAEQVTVLALEFCDVRPASAMRLAYIKEHSELIFSDALRVLKEFYTD